MFCSTSVTQHVLRGIGALALLVCAAMVFQAHALWALLALAGALVLMRGCPMCWLVGLFETIARRSRPADGKGQP
jgi:H+/gluconate symporter-like permease